MIQSNERKVTNVFSICFSESKVSKLVFPLQFFSPKISFKEVGNIGNNVRTKFSK